jgi:hypothetical protein
MLDGPALGSSLKYSVNRLFPPLITIRPAHNPDFNAFAMG